MDFGNRVDPSMTQLVPGIDPDMPNTEFEQPYRGNGQTIYDPAEMSNFGDIWHKMYPNAPTGGADRNILTPQERQQMGVPDANGYQTIGYSPNGDDSLPPPANMFPEPSLAPDLEPRFGGPGSYPISNPAPNETMYPNDMGFFPQDYPPDFNNQSFPDTVYNPAPNDFMAPPANDVYQDYPSNPNPAPNETMYPNDQGYFGSNGSDYDFSGSPISQFDPPDMFTGQGPLEPGGGGDLQWPFYVDQFPGGGGGGGGSPGAGGGSDVGTPNAGPNTYAPGNPQTINPSDPNNNLTRGGQSMPLYPTSNDVFPQPSLKDELGRPTDWSGAGQFFKDAAGNIVNGAGQIVQAAGNAVGGLINNIMNDPGYSSPDYLRSMGYTPGAGTGSLWPGQASNTNFGAGGEGGSFFGGTMQLNPGGGDISGANNPFGAGQVGRSSVGPPQGGGGPPMYGPNMGAAAWGGGVRGLPPIALSYLLKMQKGLYTSPHDFGLLKHSMPSPWASQPLGSKMNPGWNWNTYHQGQVQLHDLLNSNPALFQSLVYNRGGLRGQGAGAGAGPPQKLSQHTPQLKPA
jgi:hypothetical protein